MTGGPPLPSGRHSQAARRQHVWLAGAHGTACRGHLLRVLLCLRRHAGLQCLELLPPGGRLRHRVQRCQVWPQPSGHLCAHALALLASATCTPFACCDWHPTAFLQVPDPNNLYGPRFRFGASQYSHDPLHYLPGSSIQCIANGKFPLYATHILSLFHLGVP